MKESRVQNDWQNKPVKVTLPRDGVGKLGSTIVKDAAPGHILVRGIDDFCDYVYKDEHKGIRAGH